MYNAASSDFNLIIYITEFLNANKFRGFNNVDIKGKMIINYEEENQTKQKRYETIESNKKKNTWPLYMGFCVRDFRIAILLLKYY
jgi:hypothetical protein